MRFLWVSAILILPLFTAAQDQIIRNLQVESGSAVNKIPVVADSSHKRWKSGGMYRLSLGQGSLSNWAAGGDDFSLNINSSMNLHATHKKGHFTWDNSLDLVFGYLKTTSLGSRKNDDRLDFVTKYDYSVNSKMNVGYLFNFRSQLLRGYSYPEDIKTFSSAFLSPGYALISMGLDYRPKKKISVFLSPVTSRWIIVKDDSLAMQGAYGVDSGSNSINELGAFATANYQVELAKNVIYKTRLDMFSNYKKNPWNIDVYMTNLVAVKIFRLLSFNWSFDLIYDDDTRIFGKDKNAPALQLKSIVGAGLQVPI
ncbi:MAG: DUF3078 domain-containing protein [Ferruginibacter sp.]